MSLTATPARVRADATALLVLIGPPNRSLAWTITGSGSLSNLSLRTDAQGRATCIYNPGTPGDEVTVGVTYGAP